MRPYMDEGYPRVKAPGGCITLYAKCWSPTQHAWMRWECSCGLTTRSYDGVDRMMMRPIHPHMPVAVKGYNTIARPAR